MMFFFLKGSCSNFHVPFLVFRVGKDLVFGMSKILRLIGHSCEPVDASRVFDAILMFGSKDFSDEISQRCRRSFLELEK